MTKPIPGIRYYLGLIAGTGSALTWTEGGSGVPSGFLGLWMVSEIALVLMGWIIPGIARRHSVPSYVITLIPAALAVSVTVKIASMLLFAAA